MIVVVSGMHLRTRGSLHLDCVIVAVHITTIAIYLVQVLENVVVQVVLFRRLRR